MRFLKIGLIAAVISLLFSSCATKRSPLPYFTDIDSIGTPTPVVDFKLKIEPYDELFITVSSLSPEASAPFNLPLINPTTTNALGYSTQPQQQTYIVSSSGDIDMPTLGRIHVKGLTIEQLTDLITQKVSEYVEDPSVKVELVNFHVNISGEVRRPGKINIGTRKFTILDALAAAGDLTEYGERNSVLLVREEDGVRTSTRLNLNSAELFNSPYFYLKQNDYIYVEPNKIRQENTKYNTNNAYRLSVISTIVSGCSVVASLIIALSR